MKRKFAIIGFLLLSILTTVVAAADPLGVVLDVVPGGHIWEVSTSDYSGVKQFSGKDVDPASIEAWWWGADGVKQQITPMKVILTENTIRLVFSNDDLPNGADGTRVEGSGAEFTFFASGPGFAWRRRP